MKKKLCLLLIAPFCFASAMQAQQVKNDVATIHANGVKGSYPALAAEYPYPTKVVWQAVSDRMKKAVGKGSQSKGCYYFPGVSWPAVAAEKIDVYYTVTSGKNTAKVAILVSKGYDNFVNPAADAGVLQGLTQFLNQEVTMGIKLLSLQGEIDKQEDLLKDADKKHKSNVQDGEKLKTKVEENTKEQSKSQANLDEQSARLEKLKQELKTLGG